MVASSGSFTSFLAILALGIAIGVVSTILVIRNNRKKAEDLLDRLPKK